MPPPNRFSLFCRSCRLVWLELNTYRFDESFARNFCKMVALRLALTYGHFIISNPRFLSQRELSHLCTILAISHNMTSFFSVAPCGKKRFLAGSSQTLSTRGLSDT